ncbi:MAG: Beta-barrel assembly-enhancing protease [Anaerolineales bacterium]|nr:Beta-barrel assembly-enhancing protease [Anaerolineales bacterium]
MSKKRDRKGRQRRRRKKQTKRKRETQRSAGSAQPSPAGGGLMGQLLAKLGGVQVGEPIPLPADFPEIPTEIRAYGERQRARLSPAERHAAINRHYEAGRQAFGRGQYQQTIPEFQRAIVLMTEGMAGPEAFFNLAQAYGNLDQVEESRAVMNFYLELAPDDPDAYFSLAYAALMEEDYEECIRLSKLGRERLRDRDPTGLINLARAYQHLGRSQDAVRTLEEAIRLDPTWSAAYQSLGACYEDQLDLEQAEKYYRRAVEVDPSNQAARRNLERLEEGIVVLGPPPPWLSAGVDEE